jgi:lycopene beta-cyclase
VADIEEEEFCYIPMGGPLPAKDQRIVAFGGAAAVVHPSTGYNLCRNMMAACDVANAISKELSLPTVNLDRASAAAYHAIWSPSNIRQRFFSAFGWEFLMKQNVKGLRGFFSGFSHIPLEMWGGLLAGWPGLPNNNKHETWDARILFGPTFVSKLPLPVAVDMFLSIVIFIVSICNTVVWRTRELRIRGTTKNQGDVAAKNETRKMIEESKLAEKVPVAFAKENSIL